MLPFFLKNSNTKVIQLGFSFLNANGGPGLLLLMYNIGLVYYLSVIIALYQYKVGIIKIGKLACT